MAPTDRTDERLEAEDDEFQQHVENIQANEQKARELLDDEDDEREYQESGSIRPDLDDQTFTPG